MVWNDVTPAVYSSIKDGPTLVRVVSIDSSRHHILNKDIPGRLFVAPRERSLTLGHVVEGEVSDFVPAMGEHWEFGNTDVDRILPASDNSRTLARQPVSRKGSATGPTD
jgi:hypothetical protein